LPDVTLLGVISALGAGGVAVVILWLIAPILKASQATQDKLADAMAKQVNINGDMRDGAKERDQQINLMLKQWDLVLKAMDRNAAAAESQNNLLIGINRETTASGNRTQALHDALVSSVNDTSSAIGTMTEHLGKQIESAEASLSDQIGNMSGQFDLIPQKVLEVFEPARSELVVKLDNLGPDVAKAIVPDIEHMFKDCLELAKENDALVKEVQDANARAADAERRLALLQKPDPEPPDGSGAREQVPSSVDVIVTLPRIDGEEKAA